MNKAEEIEYLKDMIKQGEELELLGYPTGTMNEMNKILLKKLEEK